MAYKRVWAAIFFFGTIILPSLAMPANTFRDCADCPEMVMVPAGSLIMGSKAHKSESPATPVIIPGSFAIGKFEVTFNEWAACVMDGGCTNNTSPPDSGWGKSNRPVIYVTWDHSQQYISWLNSKYMTD